MSKNEIEKKYKTTWVNLTNVILGITPKINKKRQKKEQWKELRPKNWIKK
jgi:hypothetical protein